MNKFIFTNNNNEEIPNKEEIINSKDFVLFGKDNDYPNRVLNLFEKSAIFQSVVESIKTYLIGNGLVNKTAIFNNKEITQDNVVSKNGDTLIELVEKCVIDYVTFGAFSINVQRNPYGDIVYLNYVQVEKLRLDENKKYVFYSSKWSRFSAKCVKYELFDGDKDQRNSIFYFKNPTSRGIYGIPFYNSALTDIICSVKISEYNLNQLCNDFQGNTVVSFNNGIPDENTKKEIERKINEKFAGTQNTGKTIVTFADSTDQAPTITKVPEDGLADKFLNLQNTINDNIYSAFRISPTLLGIIKDGGVFNSQDYKDQWALYKATFILPTQALLEKGFKKLGLILKMNEISVDFGDVIGEV